MYFKPGLTVDELKKSYRELAKKYHPDLPNGSKEIMQEINNEFDEYFLHTFADFEAEESREQKARAVALARDIILFMIINKNNSRKVIGIERNISYGPSNSWYYSIREVAYNTYYRPDTKKWPDAKQGFALCQVLTKEDSDEYDGYSNIDFLVSGRNVLSTCLSYEELYKYFKSKDYFSRSSYEYNLILKHYKSQFGEFDAIEEMKRNHIELRVIANLEDQLMDKSFYKDGFGNIELVEEIKIIDLPFIACLGCDYEEFVNTHDVDYFSQYHSVLQMIQSETGDFAPSAIISSLCKTGIIDLYYSRLDFTMKYGSFNLQKLIRYMLLLNNEDIKEIQDYLCRINDDFESKIKSKIKKGKLRMIV